MFRKYLKESNWTEMGLYQNKSISHLFTLFTNTILQYIHLGFPLEKHKIRYKNRNPWITQELKNDIKIRDELYKLKRRSPTQEKKNKKTIIIFISYYLYTHNTYILSKQRKAERDYYNKQFQLHKN